MQTDRDPFKENYRNTHRVYVSSEVQFYTIEQLIEMLGWSEATVQKLFNAPDFPSVDFGRTKVVENHALIEYFSRKRTKNSDPYWQISNFAKEAKRWQKK